MFCGKIVVEWWKMINVHSDWLRKCQECSSISLNAEKENLSGGCSEISRVIKFDSDGIFTLPTFPIRQGMYQNEPEKLFARGENIIHTHFYRVISGGCELSSLYSGAIADAITDNKISEKDCILPCFCYEMAFHFWEVVCVACLRKLSTWEIGWSRFSVRWRKWRSHKTQPTQLLIRYLISSLCYIAI